MSTPTVNVSVIIPVYRGGDCFHRCLTSVMNAVPPAKEVIVVTNGDEESDRFARSFNGVIVSSLPNPAGPSAARNEGARLAAGEILLFVDADVAVRKDAVGRVARAFEQAPDLTAVFGSYDDSPAEPNFLSQYKNLLNHYVHQTGQDDASTFSTGCGAIRREKFLAVGGFSEDWFYMEDVELGYRLKKLGHRIRNMKDLQGKHLKRWTTASLLHSEIFCRALPWTELTLRDRYFINDLNMDSISRLSVLTLFISIFASIACLWVRPFIYESIGSILFLFILNMPLYSFFLRKKGLLFTLRVIPCHWIYYLYGLAAFGFGFLWHRLPLRPFHTIPSFDSWKKIDWANVYSPKNTRLPRLRDSTL